jgi:tetratricopeptide (TPR) repeat protein
MFVRMLAACAALFWGLASAQAGRVALVIGQNAYPGGSPEATGLPTLANPVPDAKGVVELFAGAGFEVLSCDGKQPGCFDLNREGLLKALDQLKVRAAGADLALVYFAGHGAATDEGNIVTPIDAKVNCETGAVTQGVPVEQLLQAAAPAKHKLLILDACRDNPIGEVCPGLQGKKLSFTRIEAGALQGLLLVTSTQFGQTALDGAGGSHSPFAKALIASLEASPNVYFEQVMNEVARATYEDAQGNYGFLQIPGKVVGGAAPADCLAGKDCIGDARMAALAEENGQLASDAAGVRSLLADDERARGKPYTAEERKTRVAALQATLASIGKSSDPLRQEARRLIGEGNVAGGEAKLDEALDADEKAAAEQERLAQERRKAAARSARDLAVLASGKDALKALNYYRRATKLAPSDAEVWNDYAQTASVAGSTGEAKAAYEQGERAAKASNSAGPHYWALLGLGDVVQDQGDLPAALKYYGQGQAIAEAAFRADPNNAGWQRDLSVSYDRVGDVLVAQGNLPEALKSFHDGLAIRNRLARADPNNAGWQRDLSVSYDKVGDVLVAQGNLPEALKSFHDGLAIGDRLSRADPNNAGWQHDLSVSYIKVGEVLVAQGNLPEALKSFRDSLAIRDRLAKADSGNAGWQRAVAVARNFVGNVLLAQGRLAGSLAEYRGYVEILERLVKSDPGNAGWQRDLSISYNKMGDVLVAQGNLPEALKAYQADLAIADRLAKADPGNVRWQRDLSVAYNNVGNMLVAHGNLPEALKSYRDSLAIRDYLAKSDPGNAGWQRDLSVAYQRLGDVLVAQGNQPEALKSYRDSLAIFDRLAKADPGNADWQRNLSVAYQRLGDVLVAQGNQPEALKSYRDSLAISDRLAKADPGHTDWQRDLSVAHEKVGDVLVAQGNLPEALKAYREDLAIADRLAKADPGNAQWQYDLGISNERIGKVLAAQGNLASALNAYLSKQEIISRLAQADPSNAGWQRDLFVSYIKVGEVLVAQGNLPEALKSFRDGLAIADRLAKSDPGNAGWQRDLSVSYEKMGDVLVAQGNLPEALKSFQSSLAIRGRLAEADPNNAGWQRDLSVSYDRLGDAYRRQGEMALAKYAFAKGLEIMQRMTALSPDNVEWKKNLGWFEGRIAALEIWPFQEAQAQAQAAFDAGDPSKAAAAQAKLAGAVEKAEREQAGKPGPQTASALLGLSWYRLFARDFKGALAASERATGLAPDPMYATNRAHALMFLGRAREAKGLHQRYKGQPVQPGGKLWEEAIRDDFKEFGKHGLRHAQIAEIEALLAAK